MRRAPASCSGCRCGFTLLEVMVALLIIGASLAAVFGGFYQSKRLSWRAAERLTATRLLRNLLRDRQLLQQAAAGQVSGELPGEPGWRYELEGEDLVLPGAEGEEREVGGMSRITACLVHEAAGRQKRFCLERWLRP